MKRFQPAPYHIYTIPPPNTHESCTLYWVWHPWVVSSDESKYSIYAMSCPSPRGDGRRHRCEGAFHKIFVSPDSRSSGCCLSKKQKKYIFFVSVVGMLPVSKQSKIIQRAEVKYWLFYQQYIVWLPRVMALAGRWCHKTRLVGAIHPSAAATARVMTLSLLPRPPARACRVNNPRGAPLSLPSLRPSVHPKVWDSANFKCVQTIHHSNLHQVGEKKSNRNDSSVLTAVQI